MEYEDSCKLVCMPDLGCGRNPWRVFRNRESSRRRRQIRTALDQAGFKKVSVGQDRGKGVVTLGGNVGADADKAQAEALARSLAGSEVVADQIVVCHWAPKVMPEP